MAAPRGYKGTAPVGCEEDCRHVGGRGSRAEGGPSAEPSILGLAPWHHRTASPSQRCPVTLTTSTTSQLTIGNEQVARGEGVRACHPGSQSHTTGVVTTPGKGVPLPATTAAQQLNERAGPQTFSSLEVAVLV